MADGHRAERSREVEVRAALGLRPNDLVVGMAANVQPWKGQDVVLRAMAIVAREFPDVHCVFAGGVVRGAEWYRESLEEFVRARGLGERVRFLGHRTDVPDLVNAFDVAVHASVTPEPFGRVLIEAMALGKPVVASAAGGVLEIVDDGRSGLLVAPGDHESMAAALRRLLGDAALRGTMGAEGARQARDRFSVQCFARAMQGAYAEVLGA